MLPDTHRLASRSLAALTKAQGNAAAAQEQLQELCRTLQEGHEPEPYWLAGDLSSLALEQGDAEVRAAAFMWSLLQFRYRRCSHPVSRGFAWAS